MFSFQPSTKRFCVALACICAALLLSSVDAFGRDQDLAVNQNATVHCESDWDFDRWELNGAPIADGPDYAISSSSNASELLIQSFQTSQAGEYRCRFVSGAHYSVSAARRVEYFDAAAGMEMEPQDYQSYPIADGSREIISFECQAGQSDYSVQPVVTWQWCGPSGNYTDIELEDPGIMIAGDQRRAGQPTPTASQNDHTGYLQILDAHDVASHNGTQVRCKVSSPIAGDDGEYFSSCATIMMFDGVPPPGFPELRTIPPADIYITNNSNFHSMSCAMQYQSETVTEEISFNKNEVTVVVNFFQLADSDFGILFIPNSHLTFDRSEIFGPQSHTELTYECRLPSSEGHTTRFNFVASMGGPVVADVGEEAMVMENEQLVMTFNLAANSADFVSARVFFNGVELANSAPGYAFGRPANSTGQFSVTLLAASTSQAGTYQVELQNQAGRLVSGPVVAAVIAVTSTAAPAAPSTTTTATTSTSTTPTNSPGSGGVGLPSPNTTVLILAIIIPILIVLAVVFAILLIILLCVCCNKDDKEQDEEAEDEEDEKPRAQTVTVEPEDTEV